ncbi:MAG TPA: DUF1849 family protein [Rhizomicrobium sp.]|jgi:hypothetical protein|nr:DUF1849 family protein [Rhizomicrobium sp.]
MSFASAAFAENAPHTASLSAREVYDVSLARTSGYLFTARGRTVVETHAGCGGTHTVQRSILDVTYKDGQPIRTDFTIEAWESTDGRTLRFRVRNMQSGDGTEAHDGTAKLATDGQGHVTFTTKDKPFALPRGTMLPVAFSRAMLAAAQKGHDVDNHLVFQGGGPSALVTAAVKIGHPPSKSHETAKDPAGLLKGGAAWPILISYFSNDGESPTSEVATLLYANGLLGSFSLVYPQFTLRAKLMRVERLPSSC